MKREDEPLAALLAAERDGADASANVVERIWSGVERKLADGVVPALDEAPLIPASSSGAATWWAVVGLVVAAGVGGVLAVGTQTAVPLQAGTTSLPAAVRQPRATSSSAEDTPSPEQKAIRPPQSPPESQPRSEPEGPASTPRRRSRPGRARSPESPGIAAELRLVQRITAAVERERFGTARSLIRRHRREFPRGVFVEEREAALVRIRCAAGPSPEATKALARFLARWPDSIHGPRLRQSCGD